MKKPALKDSPTSSDVHVPVAGGGQVKKPKKKKALSPSDAVPELNNLEAELVEASGVAKNFGALNTPVGKVPLKPPFEARPKTGPSQDYSDSYAGQPDAGKTESPLKVDLGSGQVREPGYVGVDLYPYDEDTLVHDVNMGLPFKDKSVSHVRMVNAPQIFGDDPKAVMSEIQRVLMPGGQFLYQGPNEIINWPSGLVMTDYESNEGEVDKEATYRQGFTRVDAATANDSEPRVGIKQFDDLPADALLAMNALDYYWSDASTSAESNRAMGYPSQGAQIDKNELTSEGRDHIADKNFALPEERRYPIHDISHARNALARSSGKPEESKVRSAVYRKYPELDPEKKAEKKPEDLGTDNTSAGVEMESEVKKYRIFKTEQMKQVVHCVVLTPEEVDEQDDWMTADDIEETAHNYMIDSRVAGARHSKSIDADVVESYIAPQDIEFDETPFGPQIVKKGSWVLAFRVNDKREWEKCLSGDYQGFSVGGMGERS